MSSERPYYDYKSYLIERFGEPVYKVSVQAGFTCPNIDGTVAKGGCTYCNNRSFVPGYLSPRIPIRQQIKEGIERRKDQQSVKKFLAYFQSFSNTYAPVEELEPLYREALEDPGVVGLVIGTRADCLPDEVVALLERLAKETYVAVEIGIESIYDRTLERINRGHHFDAVEHAFARLKGRGIAIGAHLILGLPGENKEDWLHEAEVISRLKPDYFKLHHLHIVRGTQMAHQYRKNPDDFKIFSFEEWIQLAADFLEQLDPGIAIGRVAGSAPENLLIAPKWEENYGTVVQEVIKEMERRGTGQGLKEIRN